MKYSMYESVKRIINSIKNNINEAYFFEIEIYPITKNNFKVFVTYKVGNEIHKEEFEVNTTEEDYYKTVEMVEEFFEEMEKELYEYMKKSLEYYIHNKMNNCKILNIYSSEGKVVAEVECKDGHLYVIKLIYYKPFKDKYENIPGIGAILYFKPLEELIVKYKY